jgi:hypothetical protein
MSSKTKKQIIDSDSDSSVEIIKKPIKKVVKKTVLKKKEIVVSSSDSDFNSDSDEDSDSSVIEDIKKPIKKVVGKIVLKKKAMIESSSDSDSSVVEPVSKKTVLKKKKIIESFSDSDVSSSSSEEEIKPANKKKSLKPLISKNIVKKDNIKKTNNKQIKFIEVCSGAGGLSSGFINENFEPILLNDNDKTCCDTLEKNHPDVDVIRGSFVDIDYSKHKNIDVFMGGVPCFIAGTLVLTNTGYKPIEDITLNDKLQTHTGAFQKILNLQQKVYDGILFDIRIKYHPMNITCTEEHPFYVREKKTLLENKTKETTYQFGEPIWKNAKDITKNDYFGMIVNNKQNIPEFTFDKVINQNKTEKINLKLDKKEYWFMMGYFVGDGWTTDTKKKDDISEHNIYFAINDNDEEEIVEEIRKVLDIVDKKSDTEKCKKFGCRNIIWHTLLGYFGKYAHEKFIPEWVQDAPINFIKEFIRGYMRANGCTKTDKLGEINYNQITTVSYNLAFGVQRLYLKLGYILSVSKCTRPKTTIICGQTVNQRDTYMIRGKLTESVHTSFIENNYVWFALSDISKRNTKNTNVYNFEVENDNSYIVENTIVHNCQAFSQSGKREGLEDARGQLLPEFIKLVNKITPKVFLIENVKGLTTHDGGKTFKQIIKSIEDLKKYKIYYKVLNANDYGVAQKRERLIIIGVHNNIKKEFIFPEKDDKKLVLKDVLNNVPQSEGYTYSEDKKKIMDLVPQGGCWVDLPVDIQKTYMKKSYESVEENEE